jgi:hypothetical protein
MEGISEDARTSMREATTDQSPPVVPMQSRRLIKLLIVIAFISVILGLVLPFLQRPPRFAANEITAVEVSLVELPDRSERQVTSTDPAAIAALVDALNTSERTIHFMRDPTGTITLRGPEEDVVLDILPVDNDEYQPFRVRCGSSRGIYRVRREPFLRAMEALGLTDPAPAAPR